MRRCRERDKAVRDGQIDKLARDCELFTASESAADGNFVADVESVTVRLHGLRRSGPTVLVPVKCARVAKINPACVISGQLRAAGSGALLARPLARLKLKAGRHGTLRMALTPAGLRQARRGKQVRLLIAERTSSRAPIELLARARARAQVRLF